MKAEVTAQHAWLRRLVGVWRTEPVPQPGEDPAASAGCGGTETVRMLGDIWLLCEAQGQMGGGPAHSQMALSYDPQQRCFVGTWIGSMMNHLWVYRGGTLDADERVLTLEAEGPDFEVPGKMAQYRDVIEIVGPDERLLHGHTRAPDGSWKRFMTMRYTRQR